MTRRVSGTFFTFLNYTRKQFRNKPHRHTALGKDLPSGGGGVRKLLVMCTPSNALKGGGGSLKARLRIRLFFRKISFPAYPIPAHLCKNISLISRARARSVPGRYFGETPRQLAIIHALPGGVLKKRYRAKFINFLKNCRANHSSVNVDLSKNLLFYAAVKLPRIFPLLPWLRSPTWIETLFFPTTYRNAHSRSFCPRRHLWKRAHPLFFTQRRRFCRRRSFVS